MQLPHEPHGQVVLLKTAGTSPGGGTALPLYVDVDGTLLQTDLLLESALRLLKASPLSIFSMLGWLIGGGKARLKTEIAARVDLDASRLPYRASVLELCREAKRDGRPLVLATGAAQKYAEAIALHLGLFDATIATTATVNLTGRHKIRQILDACGERGFAYAGNEAKDLHVWRLSGGAIVCGSRHLAARAAAVAPLQLHIPTAPLRPALLLKAMRIHQWAKNLLVFLPFIPLFRSIAAPMWLAGLVGFVCFGLCASSVYLCNDLLDLEADRAHVRKRRRPIPAGDLPLPLAVMLAVGLLGAAFVLAALTLPGPFLAVLAVYWLLTTAYSFDLKRRVNVDVLTLALLYTARIVAGSAILDAAPSFWMLAFSLFLFFSLAAAKRMVELDGLDKSKAAGSAPGRGYLVSDIPTVRAQGIASGQLAVLLFALYINDASSAMHFVRPQWLWGICPLLLLWINRVWMKAERGQLNEDPVLFALKDRFSRVAVLLSAACVGLALVA